ncbi:protein of unknown function [Methylocella tundrae]|uniref:Uncharacterized protein n=1 Tax=Methylocella tundrae TaxID=227605 RepID=A0A4U8Z3I8_METTU|nr:protein of unknown function [Methylocella tundrae]
MWRARRLQTIPRSPPLWSAGEFDSISVNPSSLIGALKVVADAERAAAAAR